MRNLRGSLRCSVVPVAVIMILTCGTGAAAADLSGVVREVMGDRIAIRIAPDLLPNPGDKVEVLDTVPGLGAIALDCEWRVESVQGDVVLAVTRDKSRATAQSDYKAVIHSPNPRRVGSLRPPGKPTAGAPPVDARTPDKTPPVGAGAPGGKAPGAWPDKGHSAPPSDDKRVAGDTPAGMARPYQGLFGESTSVPESAPSFEEWLKSNQGGKTGEAAPADKGTVGENKSSQVVTGVFAAAPAAAGGITLDDFVRVNQGVSRAEESARGPAAPRDFQQEEPWVVQWQVHDVLVDFPAGGRAGLYVNAVRCGQANPSPGRRGILYLHPMNRETPVNILRYLSPQGPHPQLKMGVCGNRDPEGEWILVVNVDAARLAPEKVVRGADGWQDLTYDLSGFSGRPVLVGIEVYAKDWRYDYAFFDYIRVEDVLGPPSPPETPLELLGVKAEPGPQPVRIERMILADSFDSENEGRGQLRYDGFENWFVLGGDMDLFGHGFHDAYPDHGLYVHLDGGGYLAGTLQSQGAFRLPAGTYQLEFDLAGNPERTTNTVTVSLGGLYSESLTLAAKEPFRTIRRQITAAQATNAALVFQHAGRDGAGLLLDNVRLLAISSPASTSAAPMRGTRSLSTSPSPFKVVSAYLGAFVQKDLAGRLVISDVTPQAPAEQAGLRRGDVFVQIDGRSLEGTSIAPDELARMVSVLPVDRPIRFSIRRAGQQMDIWVRPRPRGM